MKKVDYNSLCNLATKIFLGFIGAGVISIKPCFAQSTITPDNTLGTEASQVTPNVNNPAGIKSELIEGGAQRGQNLFHSFREFNVNEGRGAYFLVPNQTIQNVLTRVTGTNRSEILGTLGTTSNRNFAPTDANLFLINPNGIVFGRTASLDVNGSFVGTTANAVEFGGGFFSATNPQAPSGLLTVTPSALLFNQIHAQAVIQNNSVADAGLNPSDNFTTRGLRVPDGKSLLLVGGDISMDGGGLVALGGRVELGGLASVGTVGLNEDGNNLGLSFPDGVERSDVFLNNDAGVRVTASNGGSIAVNARNLEMTEQSDLFAGIASGLGSDHSQAGNIEINATGAINLNVSYIQNLVQPGASGQGGDVNVSASTLRLEAGSQVNTVTFGAGKGGSLSVNASEVQLIGISTDGQSSSGLFTDAQRNSTGDAGNLSINTNTLLVRDGAQVTATTFSAGKGGSLTVNATNVQLIGESVDGQVGSGLSTGTQLNSTGDAGDLAINIHTLLVQDGAQVNTVTFSMGNSGDLTVNATNVQLIGTSADGQFPSGLFTDAEQNSTGDAGDLTINTHTLLVRDGAVVGATAFPFSTGNSGDLTVNATNVQLIGTSADGQFPSGLFTAAGRNSTGDAGDLTITTSQLQVLDGTAVSASTFGAGKGGNLTVNADDVQLQNDGIITAQSAGTGTAGNINLNIKKNFTASRGQVLTQAEQSSGGNIDITAKENIFLRNNSDIKTILSTTASSGGNIRLNANAIVALEDSDILAFAPEGTGGNITFNTSAFFSDPLFRPTPQTADEATLDALDGNNRVDVNASGSVLAGTISGIPDISLFQNSLIELPENLIDSEALVASSCVVRSNERNGTFFVTGKAGLPYRPGDAVPSVYSAVDVQPVPDDTSAIKPAQKWKIGDLIVEPTGVYQLENGQLLLSRECGK